MVNQLILLLLLSFAILFVSLIILVKVFIEQIKKETNDSLILILLIGIVLSFLLPVIIGILQEIP